LYILQKVGLVDRIGGLQVSVYSGLWNVVGNGELLALGVLERCLLVGRLGLYQW